jgi:hypothetical protein
MPSQSIQQLLRRVDLSPAEAVAIVQQLLAADQADQQPVPPYGPPSVDNVFLAEDGAVLCRACVATPAVSEIATLLHSMLPAGAKLPGGLRYTLARARLEVDARPFDSLDELSAALGRQEQGDRREVLRALWNRAAPPAVAATAADLDRRRAAPSPAELRRHLRHADAELFQARSSAPCWAVGGAMAVLIAFGVGYAVVDGLRRPAHTPPAAPAPLAIHRQSLPAVPLAPAPGRSMQPGTPVPPQREPAQREPALVRAVSGEAGPTFSPSFESSGTALFFHAGRSTDPSSALEAGAMTDSGLRVMTILDDGAKNCHVQPSPDGSRLAFDSDRDGQRGVYIANRDGTGVQRVSGAGYAAVPTWSPDGTRLAFIRAETDRPRVWNLWVMNLATGADRRLTAFRYGQTWNASWFADGRRVCYTHEDRLIVADLGTGATSEYVSPVSRALVRTPAVSPDGRHVMFQVARSGAWLLDLADGSMRCVLADPTAEEFAWSPDGRRVAFHSRRDGQWGIWFLTPA